MFHVPQMQASVNKDGRYHEGTLQDATFKLTDFGRAVPYKDVLAGLFVGADVDPVQQQALQRYNRDGVVVFSDPTYQAPEVRNRLAFLAHSWSWSQYRTSHQSIGRHTCRWGVCWCLVGEQAVMLHTPCLHEVVPGEQAAVPASKQAALCATSFHLSPAPLCVPAAYRRSWV